jgi:hypothetical protein
LTKKGDSWFTGEKPGTSISEPDRLDTSAGREQDLLHLRDPLVDAGLDQRLPGG